MAFGFVVCLDSFLYTFTILPLRFFVALYHYSYHLKENLKVLVKGQGRCVYARSKTLPTVIVHSGLRNT